MTYPRQPWAEHIRRVPWQQGEHILICAPTGAGKTTIMSSLVKRRSHSVIFVSKLLDPTFEREFKGWTIIRDWPRKGPPSYQKNLLLWPKPQKTLRDTINHQRNIFRTAMDQIATVGKRCVVIDESLMFSDRTLIGLDQELSAMFYTGRSAGISMVALTQRPANIPKTIYTNTSHAYLTRTADRLDLQRLRDLGGVDAKELGENLLRLPGRYDYAYVNSLGTAPSVIVNSKE